MLDGYGPDCTKDGEGDLSDLDEYITEYVDGTMDPAMQEAFEEYLETHPELVEHICCLNDVRCVLGQLNCTCRAPAGVQVRLRQLISCDMLNAEAQQETFGHDRFRMLAVAAATVVLVSVSAAMWYSNSGVGTARPSVVQSVQPEQSPMSTSAEVGVTGHLAVDMERRLAPVERWLQMDPLLVQRASAITVQAGGDLVDPSLMQGTSQWLTRTPQRLQLEELHFDPSVMVNRSLELMSMSPSIPMPLSPPPIQRRRVERPLVHHVGASRVNGFVFSPGSGR